MTDWKKFETEYATLLATLDGVNPLDPKNEEKINIFRTKFDGLVKRYGPIPVTLYNSGVLKGTDDLNTQEKRIIFYNNFEKMQTEYSRILNDPSTYTKNYIFTKVNSKGEEITNTLNYNNWSKTFKEDLKSFSEPQKQALFSTFLYMETYTKYKAKYPFHTLIRLPEGNKASVGDCNGMTNLYEGFFSRINFNENNNKFSCPQTGTINKNPIFTDTDIQAEVFSEHMRLRLGGMIVETTSNQITPPAYDDYSKVPASERFLSSRAAIGSQLYDTEEAVHVLNSSSATPGLTPSAKTELLTDKLAYILTSPEGDNLDTNKTPRNNLTKSSYQKYISNLLIDKKFDEAMKVANESMDKTYIEIIRLQIETHDSGIALQENSTNYKSLEAMVMSGKLEEGLKFATEKNLLNDYKHIRETYFYKKVEDFDKEALALDKNGNYAGAVAKYDEALKFANNSNDKSSLELAILNKSIFLGNKDAELEAKSKISIESQNYTEALNLTNKRFEVSVENAKLYKLMPRDYISNYTALSIVLDDKIDLLVQYIIPKQIGKNSKPASSTYDTGENYERPFIIRPDTLEHRSEAKETEVIIELSKNRIAILDKDVYTSFKELCSSALDEEKLDELMSKKKGAVSYARDDAAEIIFKQNTAIFKQNTAEGLIVLEQIKSIVESERKAGTSVSALAPLDEKPEVKVNITPAATSSKPGEQGKTTSATPAPAQSTKLKFSAELLAELQKIDDAKIRPADKNDDILYFNEIALKLAGASDPAILTTDQKNPEKVFANLKVKLGSVKLTADEEKYLRDNLVIGVAGKKQISLKEL